MKELPLNFIEGVGDVHELVVVHNFSEKRALVSDPKGFASLGLQTLFPEVEIMEAPGLKRGRSFEPTVGAAAWGGEGAQEALYKTPTKRSLTVELGSVMASPAGTIVECIE